MRSPILAACPAAPISHVQHWGHCCRRCWETYGGTSVKLNLVVSAPFWDPLAKLRQIWVPSSVQHHDPAVRGLCTGTRVGT